MTTEFNYKQVATQFIQWCRPMDRPTVTTDNLAPIPKIMIVEAARVKVVVASFMQPTAE